MTYLGIQVRCTCVHANVCMCACVHQYNIMHRLHAPCMAYEMLQDITSMVNLYSLRSQGLTYYIHTNNL